MRRSRVQTAILSSVELIGVLSVAAIAPNLLRLLRHRYTYSAAYKASSRLVRKGLVKWESKGGKKSLVITPAGAKYLDQQRRAAARQEYWDEKWRIVTFDIAEKRRAYRRALKLRLQELGFERLQDSVWVFPYDCEELIALLKADYGLGKEVLYIIADSIENDDGLRKRFRLRSR